MDVLASTLTKLKSRLLLQRWIDLAARFLLPAAIAGCIWLMLARLFPVLHFPLAAPAAMLLGAAALASALALWSRPDLLDAALSADLRLGLKERLTSSLQLADYEGPMIEAVHTDARTHLAGLNISKQFPVSLPRAGKWLAVPVLIFGLGYMLLPEFDLFHYREAKAIEEALQKERQEHAIKLEQISKRLEENNQRKSEQLSAVAADLQKLARDLKREKISDKQAAARLTTLAEKLEEQRKAMAGERPIPALSTDPASYGPMKDMAKALDKGKTGEAAKKAASLKKQVEEGKMTGDQAKAAAIDLDRLAQDLAKTDSEKARALAEQFSKASRELEKLGGQLDRTDTDPASTAPQLDPKDMEALQKYLENMEQMLNDLETDKQKWEKLDQAMAEATKLNYEFLGPSEFCRNCGAALKPCTHGQDCKGCGPGQTCSGICPSCAKKLGLYGGSLAPPDLNGPKGAGMIGLPGPGQPSDKPGLGMSSSGQPSNQPGLGMLGPGKGSGNQAGRLPDVKTNFNPAMAGGDITRGRMLADIIQRSAPDQDAESSLQFAPGEFNRVNQEAENALVKEEIPPDAKKFVREYFRSMNPAEQNQQSSGEHDQLGIGEHGLSDE